MLINPQIIYTCDHIIKDNTSKYGTLTVTRGENKVYDYMGQSVYVARVDRVWSLNEQGKPVYYYENYNFVRLHGTNILQWIPTADQPAPGQQYFVLCHYIQISITKYEEDGSDCPRCYGNGWYLSFLDESQLQVNELIGMNKLVQDFIKILFTTKDSTGYGSNLNNMVGQEIYDIDAKCSEIVNEITSCVLKYKSIQQNSEILGADMSDEEKLADVVINNVEYDYETGGFFISLTIINAAGNTKGFNLQV